MKCVYELESKYFISRPPDDIQLKSITNVHDMEIVSHMWKHQDASSYPYVQRLVKFNQHIGAFKEDGTLVAWILR